MTRRELVDTFVKSYEVDGKAFGGDSVAPILPFLIGDLMLSEYTAATRGKTFSHQVKLLQSRWMETYTRFNKSFFSRYPRDAWDDITDLMDSLSSALELDLAELRHRICKIMDGVAGDDEWRICHLLTVFVLAQYAQKCWGNVYKVSYGSYTKPHRNADIAKMKTYSFEMSVAYFRSLSKGSVSLSSLNIDGIFDKIAEHLYEWVNNN